MPKNQPRICRNEAKVAASASYPLSIGFMKKRAFSTLQVLEEGFM